MENNNDTGTTLSWIIKEIVKVKAKIGLNLPKRDWLPSNDNDIED